MKVTIYNKDGTVDREVECDGFNHLFDGNWAALYRGQDYVLSRGTTKQNFLWTTKDIVVVDENGGYLAFHLKDADEQFDVTLTIKDFQRKWENCRVMLFQGKILQFWCEGKWYSVVGDVVIDNIRPYKG